VEEEEEGRERKARSSRANLKKMAIVEMN